jgi:hypothetical protein
MPRNTFKNDLVAFKLFYTKNYKEYSQKFPETEFQNAFQSYTFLQQKKMESELTTLCG